MKAEQPLSLPAFVAQGLAAYIAAGNWMIAWMLCGGGGGGRRR